MNVTKEARKGMGVFGFKPMYAGFNSVGEQISGLASDGDGLVKVGGI